uniref:Uncharacterized protein n=1 Tax=Haptolina ericina TaxID=156174 RepID=A0A7S3AJ07_9EUKA
MAERRELEQKVRAAREEATEALAHLEEDTNAATAVHETGEATLQAHGELKRSIDDFSSQQLEDRARREEEARLVGSNEEVKALRLQNDELRTEMAALTNQLTHREPHTVKMLRLRLREMNSTLGQLEAERSSLVRRATGAEEQLSELQAAMARNMAKYQKEILRLRQPNG